jgi:PAS domain-containing protein
MVPLGVPPEAFSVLTSDTLTDAAVQYKSYWHQHDTPLKGTYASGLKSGTVATDRTNMAEDEIRRDPFYQEFWYRHGIGHGLATLASLGEGRLLSVSVQRERRKEHFQPNDIDGMKWLAPHIRRAVSISAALAEARSQVGSIVGAMEQSALGVIVLDASGRLREMNAAATRMLGAALQIVTGRPRAAIRDDDVPLQRSIGAAMPGKDNPAGGSVPLRDRDGRWCLFAETAPMRANAKPLDNLLLGPGGLLVTLRNLAPPRRDVGQHLTGLGLSPAQARLAIKLVGGMSLRQAADANGVTYEAARTYLKAMLERLGLHRQTELAALVERFGARDLDTV